MLELTYLNGPDVDALALTDEEILDAVRSVLALQLLMDPLAGVPAAILDATAITEMRAGAVTAIGAEQLARRDARVLSHVGALRGQVDSGRLFRENLHGELGEIVAGVKSGRETAEEKILFWRAPIPSPPARSERRGRPRRGRRGNEALR